MTTTYISIDVATRSLAIGVYRIQSFENIDQHKDDDPIAMNNKLNDIIVPLLMKVFDINNGEKTKETTVMAKAINLKKVLESIDEQMSDQVADDNLKVVIEYQLNANHGANAIFNMIVMFYAGRYPIEVIPPAYKNKIALHPLLALSTFLGYCSNNYKANKEHTKHNMLYFLTMTDRLDMIKDIKKKNYDDIADTLCQALAFHKYRS